jgi:hypothetical protein
MCVSPQEQGKPWFFGAWEECGGVNEVSATDFDLCRIEAQCDKTRPERPPQRKERDNPKDKARSSCHHYFAPIFTWSGTAGPSSLRPCCRFWKAIYVGIRFELCVYSSGNTEEYFQHLERRNFHFSLAGTLRTLNGNQEELLTGARI